MLRIDSPISTERLILRPCRVADLEAVYAIRSREDVTRYLYWGPHTREEVMVLFERNFSRHQIEKEGDWLFLLIEHAGTVIGEVVLKHVSSIHRQGEVGFILHPDHHGRGFATEGAQAMLRLGFEGLGLHRIVGRCDGRNLASASVLERLGMRREAHLIENEWVKGEWTDEVIYAMLENEWLDKATRSV